MTETSILHTDRYTDGHTDRQMFLPDRPSGVKFSVFNGKLLTPQTPFLIPQAKPPRTTK